MVLYLFSIEVLKETTELSGSVEAIPPDVARLPSIEGRRAARVAMARRRRRVVDLLNLGGYGRRGRGAGRPDGQAPRREMAPQKLERIGFAPGNGRVPEARRPQYLVQVQGRVATFIPKIPVDGEKVADFGA